MRALRTLLTGGVDYAGLYPPASLGLASAVQRYAAHGRGPASWMLGRFVVPVDRLDDVAAALAAGGPMPAPPAPWRLVATGTSAAEEDLDRISAFTRRMDQDTAALVRVDAFETKVSQEEEIGRLAARIGGDLRLVCEIPAAAPAALRQWVRVLAQHRAAAKIRAGGLTPVAIPPVSRMAGFIWACAREGVPLKATAGLHHPIRSRRRLTYQPDSPVATVHGFLNVFVAAALAASFADALADADALRLLVDVLAEEDPGAFTFDDEGMGWREHRVALAAIASLRAHAALGFGSCSFDEPLDGLRKLGYRL